MKRIRLVAFTLVLILGATRHTDAQHPHLIFTATSNSGPAGSITAISVLLDNAEGPVAGWSYGLCNGPGVEPAGVPADNGAYDFNERSAFPDGVTQGVVICFTGCNPIPIGTNGLEMLEVEYTIDPGASIGDETPLDFCNTLGLPSVATVAVVNGASVVPTQVSGMITVGEAQAALTYIAPVVGPIDYRASDGIGGLPVTLGYSISEEDNGVGLQVTQGFSMGLSHDDTLLSITAVNASGAVAALNSGVGPDFFETRILSNGFTVGCVYCFTTCETLSFPENEPPVVTVDYEGVPGALVGVEGTSAPSPLTWDNMLGTPPVPNVLASLVGTSISALLEDGSVSFNGTVAIPFETGDANTDGVIDIADMVWILQELFNNGPMSTCAISRDTNGDGAADAADPVFLSNYLFLGGPPLVHPFMVCDIRVDQTEADCLVAGCVP